MRFEPLTSSAKDETALREEYNQARKFGKLRLGPSCLFFKKGLKAFYIPYSEISRYFRRIMVVPGKLCCGRGDFKIEHLVICGEAGELAQIQLPGAKAAKVVMECMAQLAPNAAVGRPGADTTAAQQA